MDSEDLVVRGARSRELLVASASFLLVAETDGAAMTMDARRTMTMVAKAAIFLFLINFLVAVACQAMTKWL